MGVLFVNFAYFSILWNCNGGKLAIGNLQKKLTLFLSKPYGGKASLPMIDKIPLAHYKQNCTNGIHAYIWIVHL